MELEPYFVPHIGQFNQVRELCKPKDRFHTFKTRSNANIRERIKIDSEPPGDELIDGKRCMMATGIDEFYQVEFYHERSRSCFRFKPITEIVKLRETFRKKMDINWMKERMALDKIETLKQESIIEKTKLQMEKYEKFLSDYKEKSYHESMKAMKAVKVFYYETDQLKKRRDELVDSIDPLKMRIFYLGNAFVHLTILQKFQYLLKPSEWRLQHDHIHRTPEGSLESFKDSIANRETAQLWNRDSVSVFTIKDFILNDYLKCNRKPIEIFETGAALVAAYRELHSKSYRTLRQFHSFAQALADTEKDFMITSEKNDFAITNLNRLAQSLGKKRVFMEQRAKEIASMARRAREKPLADSFSSETLRSMRGICDNMFKHTVLRNGDASLINTYTAVEKTAEVEKKVLRLLEVLDKIPRDLSRQIEIDIRSERKRKLTLAERAYKIELNVQHRIAQLRRSLSKPPAKTKREGKLAMSVLPKKPSRVVIVKPLLTPIEEEYVRAFTELGSDGEIKFDESARQMIDRIKNESIPFYLDHLLDTLGIKMARETEAQAENVLRDEMETLKCKDVLSSVISHVKNWEKRCEKVKQDNIRKTTYLYQ